MGRQRVKHFNTHGKDGGKLSESDWSSPKVHKHFKKLENVRVNMQTSDDVNTINVTVAYNELALAAVKSYFARIMPKLMFTPMCTINGSLGTTVQYMVHATEWIGNLVKTAKKESTVLTPFQFDLCIAVGEPQTKDEI